MNAKNREKAIEARRRAEMPDRYRAEPMPKALGGGPLASDKAKAENRRRRRKRARRGRRAVLLRRVNAIDRQRRDAWGSGDRERAEFLSRKIERLYEEFYGRPGPEGSPFAGKTATGVTVPGSTEVDTMWKGGGGA